MPNTKEELYLAAILGEYSGELPLPNTKVECYLYKLAIDGVPGGSGSGAVDLSEYAKKEELLEVEKDVEKLLNDSTRHVHTNMQALMEITNADITALHSTFPQKIYEIEQSLSDYATKEEVTQATEKLVQLESNVSQLNRKTIKFRHGKGTFNATATGTNIVWKYGSQEIQGENCTFDVKSDNGLIVMEFDEMTKIKINNDDVNKLCLSDLGGNITNTLNLNNCSQITGDLSDLGGNITNNLSILNCSQITGDLSDLGGNIKNYINLNNCSQITGDLSDLGGNITNDLNLWSCSNITGDLSDLGGNIKNTLNINNCSQITGDLSDLGGNITNTLSISNCSNIIGIYNVVSAFPKTIDLSKTAITTSDMDQNLINAANSGVENGKFTANNMTRTAASDDAIAILVANGWTVSGLTKVEV